MLKATITVSYDLQTKDLEILCEPELDQVEMMGMLEVAKMIVMRDDPE